MPAHDKPGEGLRSTTLLSIFLFAILLIPVAIGLAVDDDRFGGVVSTPQTESFLDWEDIDVQGSTRSGADPGGPQPRNVTGVFNESTTIAGESLLLTSFYDGNGPDGAAREAMRFALPVKRSTFVEGEPTILTVKWVRDDVVDGNNDIDITYFVCPTTTFCDDGTHVDFANFINLANNVWDAEGSVNITISVFDFVAIENLASTPSGGQDFVAIQFQDDTIAEDVGVVMDAQMIHNVEQLRLGLDQFRGIMWFVNLLFALVLLFMFESISLETFRSRPGSSGGSMSTGNVSRVVLITSMVTLALVALAGLVSAGVGNQPSAGVSLIIGDAAFFILMGLGFIFGILGAASLAGRVDIELRWMFFVGLLFTFVAFFALQSFIGFYSVIFTAGIASLATLDIADPNFVFGVAAVLQVLIGVVALVNIVRKGKAFL